MWEMWGRLRGSARSAQRLALASPATLSQQQPRSSSASLRAAKMSAEPERRPSASEQATARRLLPSALLKVLSRGKSSARMDNDRPAHATTPSRSFWGTEMPSERSDGDGGGLHETSEKTREFAAQRVNVVLAKNARRVWSSNASSSREPSQRGGADQPRLLRQKTLSRLRSVFSPGVFLRRASPPKVAPQVAPTPTQADGVNLAAHK